MASPTDIIVTPTTTYDEYQPAGTVFATLSAVDADIVDGDTFIFNLVGSSDFFEIQGNEVRLKAGAVLDFDTPQNYTITVRVQDFTTNDGTFDTFQKAVTILVEDVNEVTGTSAGETINGIAGLKNRIDGAGGNDTITGGNRDDVLTGSFGNDILNGGGGNDYLLGGTGTDTLNGQDGNDVLESGGEGGTLDGGADNDELIAGTASFGAAETLIGGDGNDIIRHVGLGSAEIVYGDDNAGNSANDGDDTVLFSTSSLGVKSTVTLGGGRDTLGFDDGSVIFTYAFADITDFTVGATGDKVDITEILDNITGFSGANPFATGHMRLAQEGAHTLLQVDADGTGSSSSYATVFRFLNTTATAFTASNFVSSGGATYAPSFNNEPTATITGSFTTTEQVVLDLKGKIQFNDLDNDVLSVTISVNEGVLNLLPKANNTLLVVGGGTPTLTITGTPSAINALLQNNNDGFSYQNDSDNPSGSVTLEVHVNDGGPDHTYTQQIAITAVNDAPTTGDPAPPTDPLAGGTEDQPYTVHASDLLAGFVDPEGDTLSVADLTAGSLATPNGTVADNGNGTFTVTPNANFNGTMTLNYSVVDQHGGKLEFQSRYYQIAPVPDAPVGSPTGTLAPATEDVNYTVTQQALLQGFSDPDGDTLTVANLTVDHGHVTANANGTFTITPDANFNGTMTLTYDVLDGDPSHTLVGRTRSLTVNPVNDAPTGAPTASLVAGTENADYIVLASDLLQGFTDPEGQTLSIAGLTASNGTVTNNNNGTYTIKPVTNFNGTMKLTYSVTDGAGGSLSGQTRSYSVGGVPSAPTLVKLSGGTAGELAANNTLVGTLSTVDPDGTGTFTYQLVNDAGGRFSLVNGNEIRVANGLLLDYEQAQNHVIQVRSTDDAGLIRNESLVIRISDVAIENIVGNASANTFVGGRGDDSFDGGGGADVLKGGLGNDTYIARGTETIVEATAAGTDTVRTAITYTLGSNLENLTLTGTSSVNGTGNALANAITGNSGNNSLFGLDGNDTLSGGAGVDVITGGAGKDTMTGGTGNDRFDFDALTEMGKSSSTRDIITDFARGGDDIDLSTIDASTKSTGNQAFTFIGTGAFTQHAGELRIVKEGGAIIVMGDVNGDGAADFQIQVDGTALLSKGDFIL
jgi:Ca2+-binding RTX toxin-like protein